MTKKLNGKKVAILATDGFEQSELEKPKKALEDAGAMVHVVSPRPAKIRGWKHGQWGDEIPVDVSVEGLEAADYDALVLPGGVMNPDRLRRVPDVQRFVRSFFDEGKPVAAICHGPWTLVDAGVVRGRKMTSYESIQLDLVNAGAEWVDEEVVVDRGLVTSRKPDDLPAFIERTIEAIAVGQQRVQRAGL